MRFSVFLLATILAFSAGLAAQSSPPSNREVAGSHVATVSAPHPVAFSDRAPRYRLRRGDSFDLQFEFAREFNQSIAIQPDGYITLQSAGSMVAEGLTIPELTTAIEKKYAGILHDPVVTIELKDFDKPFFIATGQVGKPGKYDLRSDLTVTEGVALAGGFTEASKHSRVVLFRPGPDGIAEAHVIDVKKMLHARNLNEDIHLQPGDMIYVPQNQLSKFSRYLPTSSLGLYGYPQSGW